MKITIDQVEYELNIAKAQECHCLKLLNPIKSFEVGDRFVFPYTMKSPIIIFF